MSVSPADVSVAIPVKDGRRTLPRVLEGVAALDPAPAEVLVVDDGSRDGSGDLARERGSRVVRFEENRGLAVARNRALVEVTTPYILFLDADVVPPRDILLSLLDGLDAPEVAGVGGREGQVMDGSACDLWRTSFRPQSHGDTDRDDVWMLPGLCALYRRTALEEIGGFDETFRSYGEDVDVGIRLRAAGYRLAYRARAVVAHIRRDGTASLLQLCFSHSRGGAAAMRRNGLDPWTLLAGQLRWALVAVGSCLLTHRRPLLALASPLFSLAGLAGVVSGALGGRQGPGKVL